MLRGGACTCFFLKMDKIERLIKEINKEILEKVNIHCSYNKYCGKISLEDIFTTDSVYIAACRCSTGFGKRNDTRAFMKNVWRNSYLLSKKVLNGKFVPKYYKQRVIVERGKSRLIKPPHFECKIVQKLLCDYLIRPILEPRMISTNYASVRGRGTEKLLRDLTKCLNDTYIENREAYITIADYSNFFASINHDCMRNMLNRYIADDRIVSLIMLFAEDKGLSLGNETSQLPASFFPSYIDHLFKDKMNVKFFRYMDDSIFISENICKAKELSDLFIELSHKEKLIVKEDKIQSYKIGATLIFCKERLRFNKEKGYYYRNINPRIVSTERRKLNKFSEKIKLGMTTKEYVKQQYKTVRGMIKSKPNTYSVICELDDIYKKIW